MNMHASLLARPLPDRAAALLRGWRCVTIFLLFGALAGLVHYAYYTSATGRSSLFELGNVFGDLIEQLVVANRYEVCKEWPFPGWGYRCFVAHRLPAIPLFLAAIGKISDGLLLASVVKNLVFFGFSGAAVAVAFRNVRPIPIYSLLPVLVLLLLPYNVFVAASLEFEEGYVFHLLPAALIAVSRMENRGDVALASVALFLMALTKSTLTVLCVFLAAWGAYRAARHLRSYGAATGLILSVALACASWASFTHAATGRAAWGPVMSTWNGWHLYKANHPKLFSVYPRYSPDYLDLSEPSGAETVSKNEWDLQHYYQQRGLEFIQADVPSFALNTTKKTLLALFEARETATQYGESRHVNYSMLVNRMIFFGLLALLVKRFVDHARLPRSLWPILTEAAPVAVAIALYLGPYLVGFVYHRHVIPIIWTFAIWSATVLAAKPSLETGTEGSMSRPRRALM